MKKRHLISGGIVALTTLLALTLTASAETLDERMDRQRAEQAAAEEQAAVFSVDMSTYPDTVMHITNEYRISQGLPALASDPVLKQLTQQRVEELVQNYSHTRPNGTRWNTLFEEYTITVRAFGENMARGVMDPEEMAWAWIESQVHHEIITHTTPKYAEVACAMSEEGSIYWIQMFAK